MSILRKSPSDKQSYGAPDEADLQPINGHVTSDQGPPNDSGSSSGRQAPTEGGDRIKLCHCPCEACCPCLCCPEKCTAMLYRVRQSSARVWALLIFMLCYLFLGSLIFMALESPHEKDLIGNLRKTRDHFLNKHPCMTGDTNVQPINGDVTPEEFSQSPGSVKDEQTGRTGQCCPARCCPLATVLRRSSGRLLALAVFMLLYTVLGSIAIMYIEIPFEQAVKHNMRISRSNFMASHPCIKDAELEAFVVEIIEANNRGVSAARNVSSEPNWSFGQSLFFAGTILTTIGYGHVTPLSEGGKVFCIVYAAIGIPLTLIMFTALVERLMVLTTGLLQVLTEKMGHMYKTIHIRLIHLTILLLIVIVFVFLIPSAIFTLLEENWNYLDAFYYCFISMTTIGLGDYIPGDDPEQKHRPLYKICTTFYLFVGLVLMMLTLANIYDVPELNLGYHFYMRSDEEDSERTSLRTNEPVTKYTQQVNRAYTEEGSKTDERKQLTDN